MSLPSAPQAERFPLLLPLLPQPDALFLFPLPAGRLPLLLPGALPLFLPPAVLLPEPNAPAESGLPAASSLPGEL